LVDDEGAARGAAGGKAGGTRVRIGRRSVDEDADEGGPDRDGSVPRLRVVSGAAYGGWEEIYRDNVARLYRVMYGKVGNRADAEDLTAEVFLTALRPLRTSASVGEVRAYLLATARTVLAAHWRRTLGVAVTTLDDERVETVFGDPPAGDGTAARADAILGALPERYRTVLRLRFLEGCSVRDTAEIMGISVGNAKVLQHRALRSAAEVGA
jgi:RNA polymerase sigma factor (sigma-70 family)